MAAAQLTRALSAVDAPVVDAEVRVGIHDASRLEWSASIPLPEGEPLKYELEAVLDIPSNAFAKQAPWDQLQTFTRLDGPAEPVRTGNAVSIDALRRSAVGVAARLSRASDGFARDCRLAASLLERTPPADLEDRLLGWIESALAITDEARRDLATPRTGDPAELTRERRLVDEYVSVRMLEFFAGVERGLAALLESRAPHAAAFPPVAEALESTVADALEKELRYRGRQGYVRADAGSVIALERYLDRASQLKKHFQEVLFLDAEIFQVAERIHHFAAGVAALIASSWAFAAQVFLLAQPASTTTTLGSGLLLLGVLGGIVYVAKDRLKEIGRIWISGHVGRYYAQRVARYRAPVRRLPSRDVIVSARESFEQKTESTPDPLNPESGARLTSTLIRYVHKGVVVPQPALARDGVRRIKHVVRYDLSPLFARLDDSTKQVPVLDGARRVRFVDAPRCYRLPVRLSITCAGRRTEENVTLVVHKRGLDRLERGTSIVELPETGLEPDHQEEQHTSVRPPPVGESA